MNPRLLYLGLVLLVPACNRTAAQIDQPAKASAQPKTRQEFDFVQLLGKIKNCNEKELSYFDRNWDGIHEQLKSATANSDLADLPLKQQEELWDALAYLQGCRNGTIKNEHGDDMARILLTFGTPEQLELMRAIYPNGVQEGM